MIVLQIIGAIVVTFWGFSILCAALAIYFESKGFNKGKCVHCGNDMHCFDTDSQRGRGYMCSTCGYTTWVSYKFVDREMRYRTFGDRK